MFSVWPAALLVEASAFLELGRFRDAEQAAFAALPERMAGALAERQG